MTTNLPPQKGRDTAISFLNGAIEALNLAKEISSATPAKAVFGSASVLLGMIRDSMANEQDYVELGLFCADVCKALDLGSKEGVNDFNESMRWAIEKLTTTVAKIQEKIVKHSRRGWLLRGLHSKSDKDAIAAWRQDLHGVLLIFNAGVSMNNYVMFLDLYRNALAGRGPTDHKDPLIQANNPLGEVPPPPPRACFGRDDLIEDIINTVESLRPIALTGAGGIGKTSVALALLHHDRIKERFGDNRRFIRCDQFPASGPDLLRRLSKVIGAGIENPHDMASLRAFLSSEEMFIILDNAESILDPKGKSAQEIYDIVEELSRFNNICLCITSRITTVPPDCKRFGVPTLSIEAARSAFRRIYNSNEQPDLIDNILRQLEFHPLSITLLATVAHQCDWDNNRLGREWDRRRTDVLHPEHSKSLAATIGLSLASPMFKALGPDAPGLLETVAFFPQGLNEDNLDWLFPTIADINTILDKFCTLSLTYRSKGFVTMLAPLRDHLRPKNPMQSLPLRTIKEQYFTRLSIVVDRFIPGSGDGRWITSEDVNVEHLLDVFTSIDPDSETIWEACANFMNHLCSNKKRQTALAPKIHQLPDDHPSKPRCLLWLSWLFGRVGNYAEHKRLASHALWLYRERRDDDRVAEALLSLCDANRKLEFYGDGIEQAKEALMIQGRLGNAAQQAKCLNSLAWLLFKDRQFDAAEEVVFFTINLLPENRWEFLLCVSHQLLGNIYRCKDRKEDAIRHLVEALRIAFRFNFYDQPFWIHYCFAWLFRDREELNDAHAHIIQAKLYTIGDAYYLGRAAGMHATILYDQCRFEEARSEALRAIEVFGKLGSVGNVATFNNLLREIERAAQVEPWEASGDAS